MTSAAADLSQPRSRLAEREIGRSGLFAPAMALGCYAMSHAYGARRDADSIAVIHAAVDRGITLIDTADYYGRGHNEELVAEALQGRRDVILSSKFGYVVGQDGTLGVCGQPAHVAAACEASLRRLKTDCIDLYFQHRVDPDVPIEETVGAMADLVRAGKVRLIGLCEVSDTTLRRAHAVHPVSAVQMEYSLWTRDVEAGLRGVLSELGISLMAFSPLARGMLTDALRSLDQLGETDVRRKYPRFSPENFPSNLALVDRLGAFAARRGATISQVALAWLYRSDPALFAICGCDTLGYLDENLGALDLALDPDELEEIGALFEPGSVAGDRYHPAMMRILARN